MRIPDFDSLAKMAKQNPQEFEALREKLVEQAIASAKESNQRRLRGLQFQIDMTRQKAKTPLAACIQISSLMHDSLAELRDYLNGHRQAGDELSDAVKPAEVIAMHEFKSQPAPVDAV